MGMWNELMIRQHSAYVNACRDSFMQYNCKITIDVDTLNGVRTFCSYSQLLSWIVGFLQIFCPGA
jgi:hypothetical protein